ncbi:MAG: hypothetical protein CL930_12900 [Deltaproteobacteria bacterium]|nr:hypothetical protein [Deltaproteobacteria bacterium]|tara:strand:+ start:404 stop:751 length:348 start_codon:yes stop_codon:yes gene_type:complete
MLLALFSVGCAHKVRIESDPSGAAIKIDRAMVGVTPAEVEVKWVPFKPLPVYINMPGRRTVEIDLADDLNLFKVSWQAMTLQVGKLSGDVPRETHRAIFVGHHGPMGTWTPEDVK